MSVSKEDILKSLKDQGINNLEDLAKAASENSAAKTTNFSVFVHKNYAFTS